MKRHLESPIDDPKNVYRVLSSCLTLDGQKTDHSRNLIIGSYRQPKEERLSVDKQKALTAEANAEILKHFAKKYLIDLKMHGYDLSKPLSYYYPEIYYKELTGNDLLMIHTKSTAELVEFTNDPKNMDKQIQDLLVRFGLKRCGLESGIGAEHFSSAFLYRDDYSGNLDMSHEEGEVLMKGTLGYSKRIYMNLPKTSGMTLRFGVDFVKKCIDRGVPFDMKLFGAFGSGLLDNTVFYSKNKYFKDHIQIINEVITEHPEYKEYMGDPIYTGGRVIEEDGKCYYAISGAGNGFYSLNKPRLFTFNDEANYVINTAYLQTCIEIIQSHFPYFCNKFDRETLMKLTKISSMPKDDVLIAELDNLKKEGLVEKIRAEVKGYIDYKKSRGEEKEIMDKMAFRMNNNYKELKSQIKYGDNFHMNVPLYRDENFDLCLKSMRKDNRQL